MNRTRSRNVTGLLAGHNTLRKHLHLMELIYSPLCRCEEEEETSAHILCECEALASFRHAHLDSLLLDPEDIKRQSLGPSRTSVKEQGSLDLASHYAAQRVRFKALVYRDCKGSNPNANQSS